MLSPALRPRVGPWCLVLALVASFSAAKAHANPEPPALYNARIVGMGGTGTSHVEGPGAVLQNPARLYTVNRFSIEVATLVLLVNFRATFAGPGQEQNSGINVAPLAFLGGAGKIGKRGRFHLGLAGYVVTGFGGGFRGANGVNRFGVGVPCASATSDRDQCFRDRHNQEVALAIFEAAVPMSFRIRPNFSIGVSLRMPFGFQQVDTYQEFVGAITRQQPTAGNGWGRVQQSVIGVGTPGVMVGIDYQPVRQLSLGVVYRSKVRVDMAGDTDMDLKSTSFCTLTPPIGPPVANPVCDTQQVRDATQNIATKTSWYVPHLLKFGATLKLYEDRLRISAEFRMTFNKEANREQVFHLEGASAMFGVDTIRVPFNWHNVYGGLLGAEYFPKPRWPIRLGLSLGNSATNANNSYQFAPPPGLQYAFYAGAGFWHSKFHFDVAIAYGSGTAFHRGPPTDGSRYYATCQPGSLVKTGCAGDQAIQSLMIGTSVAFVH